MPCRFRDSRSRMTESTTKAPLPCQRIPVAAFSRGAGVSPGRRNRQRTAPARNRPEVQDPRRNRRPFPAKPPRIRSGATEGKAASAVSANAGATRSITGGATAGEAAAADEHEHVAKRMLAPDAPQTIARKRSWRTPVGPRTRPYKKQPSSTPAKPPKKSPITTNNHPGEL